MQNLPAGINHAFGRSPLWVGLYSTHGTVVNGVIRAGTGPNAQYRKEIWAVGPQLRGVVTIRGWNLASGKPVRFGHSLQTAQLILRLHPARDASMRASASGHLLFYGDYVFFPTSGCYVLVGRWNHGTEFYPFAVGR
jgi:hypothetical protein